jgi:hypothetical protein
MLFEEIFSGGTRPHCTRSAVNDSPARTKSLLIAGFVAAAIQLADGAEALRLIERPNAGAGPTQVSVGIWIVDINSIDSAQQSFTADGH